MRRAALMLIQFFAGFGVYVVLQVGWWVLKLPYETDIRQGDLIYLDFGVTAWAVTLGLFVLCQFLSYWGVRRCLSIPTERPLGAAI